jgi:hypothetical protein
MIAPVELFTGATFQDFDHISTARVWGCPAYVLDPKLQDGKKIPKWDPRARRGMFVGRSPAHSNTVGCILNLRTGSVSPQYHVVYDDLFSTVPNGETGGIVDDMPFNPQTWQKIVESGVERRIDEVEEASSGTPYVPSLDREWLSEDELPPAATNDDYRNDIVGPTNLPTRTTTPPPSLPVQPEPPPQSTSPTSPEGDNDPIGVIDPCTGDQFVPNGVRQIATLRNVSLAMITITAINQNHFLLFINFILINF